MTAFLDAVIAEAVQHPVYAVLLVGAVWATVGAWVGSRQLNRLLTDFDGPAPVVQSNVRVLPVQRGAS